MEPIDTAVVISRVLTTGVVMSIEKNDRELPGLQRLLGKRTGKPNTVLVNSRTAGIHVALVGQGYGYGDTVSLPSLGEPDAAFVAWLGLRAGGVAPPAFEIVAVTGANAAGLEAMVAAAAADTVVVDLTGLGFGPAAAVLTGDERVWARGERLKIFGAFDLRTMWTQQESEPGLAPGVQFNYRLSPLVAACLRMALMEAVPSGAAR
jgi:hypothetical protein